jgi:hypothetical protein
MRSVWLKLPLLQAILLLGASLAAPAASSAPKPQSFTGRVSDAMCGTNHMMAGPAADCVRACLSRGAKYALVVGDRVYTLETRDKSVLDELDQLADKQVKVIGQVSGDVITVDSVAEAK